VSGYRTAAQAGGVKRSHPCRRFKLVERRPWRTVDADLLRFTTTDLRGLHLAIMTAFEESAVLAPALNLDQVRSSVGAVGWDDPVEDDVLQRAMAALSGWGLLEACLLYTSRCV